MLDGSSDGFNGRSGVLSRMPGALKTLSAFGPVDFPLGKTQFEARGSFARCCPAAVLQSERTGLADLWGKAGNEACRSARFYLHCLSIGAGEAEWFALFIGGEVKLTQAEFVSPG